MRSDLGCSSVRCHAVTFIVMVSAAVLLSAIFAATGPQEFPAAINVTAAALGRQAEERFAAKPSVLDLCKDLYHNDGGRYFASVDENLVDADFEVIAFFLARDAATLYFT